MLTFLLIFLTIAIAGGYVYWYEEGPARFAMPDPLLPPPRKRYVGHTQAGYKPPKRKGNAR